MLSTSDLEGTFWVQADPNQVEVTVIDPIGARWTQANAGAQAAVNIELADRGSNSGAEVSRAQFLESNGTLVSFGRTAVKGTYRIQLSGANLAADAQIVVRQTTFDDIFRERKRHQEETLAAIYASPEQRVPIPPSGRATALIPAKAWESEDVVLVATSFAKRVGVTIKMPDGTVVTQSTAKQLGCRWGWDEQQGWGSFSFLKAAAPHLNVDCPKQMTQGAISVTVDSGAQAKPGELAVAVLRPKNVAELFKKADADMSSRSETLELFHQVDPRSDEQVGFARAIVGRKATLRMKATEPQPIATIAVTAHTYEVDAKKNDVGLTIEGPHASKKLLGPPQTVIRRRDGNFTYSFTPAHEGNFQVDFEVEGAFANGRRFEATSSVHVFAQRLAARVIGIRQERIDLNQDGTPDIAIFHLDLDIMLPGQYSFSVHSRRFGEAAFADRPLAAGRQKVRLEGGCKFLADLNLHRAEESFLSVDLEGQTSDKPRAIVAIDVPMPKAGTFTIARPGRGGSVNRPAESCR